MKKISKKVRKRRGLFPWRPKFPPRITKEWDMWYRDWIIDGPFPARIEEHRDK